MSSLCSVVDPRNTTQPDSSPFRRQVQRISKTFLCAARIMGPTLLALSFAGASSVAHAQGTMDFSGAQTLMGTFKTLGVFLRRADESAVGRALVECAILVATSRSNSSQVLREAATVYKVDTEAIAAKVKQEFSVKEKAKKTAQPAKRVAKSAA